MRNSSNRLFTQLISASTACSRRLPRLLRSLFVARGDQHKPIDGEPQLPKQFLDQLLRAPVIATITKLETEDQSLIATIDRGSQHGLRKGMALMTLDEHVNSLPDYRSNRIISVELTTAKVRMGVDVSLAAKLTTRVANVDRY